MVWSACALWALAMFFLDQYENDVSTHYLTLMGVHKRHMCSPGASPKKCNAQFRGSEVYTLPPATGG